MWTAKGQTKSVHNSEVSTLVKLGVAMGHRAQKPNGPEEKCPQWRGVNRARFYFVPNKKILDHC